jgi:hypothetical protein
MLLRYYRAATQATITLVVAAAIAACGGNQSAPQNNATVAPPASPMTEVQKEIAALPLSQQAPIPRGLNCKGDVVWVNTAKKTYHESGDPYFGRTKHGEYMCKAAANAAGYHLAGTRHSSNSTNGMTNSSGSMSNSMDMSNSSNSMSSSSSGHRHHRQSSSSSGGN